MPSGAADHPSVHYDNVTQAWRLLMGGSFHYGYFKAPDDPLEQATDSLTEELIRAGQLQGDSRVLDVGCGIGGPAIYLARRLGCRVVGISTSEVGVSTANELAESEGLADKLSFRVRDGMQNGFEDASFDRIWVMESSHLMPDKAAMIRDSARVLEPGGRVVLCDIIMHRDLPITEVLKRAGSFDLLRRVFGRAKMETLSSYASWFGDAGLEVDCSEDLSEPVAPTFERWRENSDRHRDAIVERVGEEAWSDFREACGVLGDMWAEGILGYGLISGRRASR